MTANIFDCSLPEFPERRQAVDLVDQRDQRGDPVTVGSREEIAFDHMRRHLGLLHAMLDQLSHVVDEDAGGVPGAPYIVEQPLIFDEMFQPPNRALGAASIDEGL